MVQEIKSIVARYFVTCFSLPDTFDLNNPYIQVADGNPAAQNQNFGWPPGMQGFGGSAEELSSHNQFTFSKMQTNLWEAARETNFLMH